MTSSNFLRAAPTLAALVLSVSVTAQNVVNFPHDEPMLDNGWQLDADRQINNPLPPPPLPRSWSTLAAGPTVNDERDFNSFSADLVVEPAKITGGATAYALNTTVDEPLYHDVDFVTYYFTFDPDNDGGYSTPMAGGGCSLAGEIRAASWAHRIMVQDGAARVAAGQKAEVRVGNASAVAQDQQACAVQLGSEWTNFSVTILGVSIPVTIKTPDDDDVSETKRLGDSSTILEPAAASAASVAFRSEAEVKVMAWSIFWVHTPGLGVQSTATANSGAEARLTLSATRDSIPVDEELVVEGESSGNH